jgi:catalase
MIKRPEDYPSKATAAEGPVTDNVELKKGGDSHQTAGRDIPPLTTEQGAPVGDNQNSLKAGERGPTLMEDHHLREKIFRFDHERIPERVVHARGFGAHGYFQVYEPMAEFTKAKFLQDPSVKTPVFVRFSTVVGSRGSADTVRDVRGFATKFYTEDGNYDLVANNIPIFFIQDAIKFPDVVHALKPEPIEAEPCRRFPTRTMYPTPHRHFAVWALRTMTAGHAVTMRNASASQFADDIQRFLSDKPVDACPRSSAYNVR